jgi:hypothetical protein
MSHFSLVVTKVPDGARRAEKIDKKGGPVQRQKGEMSERDLRKISSAGTLFEMQGIRGKIN